MARLRLYPLAARLPLAARSAGVAALASGYGEVLLAALAATGLLLALQKLTPVSSPALVYLAIVAMAAARYGLGPALLSTTLGILALELLFVPTNGTPAVRALESTIRLVLFVAAALMTSALTASQRRAAVRERCRAEELNRVIAQMTELEHSREEFIRTISHDLRAPLTVILGHAEFQQRLIPAGKVDQALKAADAIVGSAKRMNAMIQDLVDSARLEAGSVQLNLRPVRLQEALSELVERASVLAGPGRIRVDVPADLPPVRADPDRLDRIVMNLVSNALKYSPPGSPVEVSARREDGNAVVSVVDHGVGIPAEALPHLFRRYYRVEHTAHREGLGLGLYISRLLVEAQGGTIGVESQAGAGSAFHFTIPLAVELAPAGERAPALVRRG